MKNVPAALSKRILNRLPWNCFKGIKCSLLCLRNCLAISEHSLNLPDVSSGLGCRSY